MRINCLDVIGLELVNQEISLNENILIKLSLNKCMKYDKLVRNKISEYIRSKGVEPDYHIASEEEYWLKLKAKIREEAGVYSR